MIRLYARVSVILFGFCLLSYGACAQAQASPKGDVRVYIAQDESARRALDGMLAMYGRKLVGDSIPNRNITGKFEVRNVEEVMDYFKSAFQINWYQNGTNVYVYQSRDWRTVKIHVGGARSNEEWKEYVTAAGLYYKEFPFVFQPDSKELVVSGPRSYISLVENAFSLPRPDPSEIEKHGVALMVYPLKHASVEDRQTALRGTVVTTPGALTVLLNLLGMPRQNATVAAEDKKPGAGVEKRFQGTTAESSIDRLAEIPSSPISGISKRQDNVPPEQQDLPSITADSRTNSILIRDARSKYQFYKDLIDKLDQAVSMIEVEATMVEVDLAVLNELGVEFGLLTRNAIYEFPGPSVPSRRLLNPGVFSTRDDQTYPPDFLPGSSSVVDPVRFMARLKALSADDDVKVLARPKILTQDNVSAFIDLSQTVYFSVTGERVANLTSVTAGSLLQVTPRLVRDNLGDRIFLRIEIQDGSLADDVTQASNLGTRVSNTALNTQALIHHDKAILVGGYNREINNNSELKVPVLGDLPFIGAAFRSKEKRTRTVVRLFLITPRIIDDSPDGGESTRSAISTMNGSFPNSNMLSENNGSTLPSLRMDSSLTR